MRGSGVASASSGERSSQELVLHVDQVERFGRGLLVLRDDRGNRIADVAHRARRRAHARPA
jgi:hypothetical protein